MFRVGGEGRTGRYHIPDGWVQLREASAMLGVDNNTFVRWEQEGLITCGRNETGRRIKIYPRAELERLGLVVAPAEVGHRVAFGDAMIPGQGVTEYRPGSTAAQEIEGLFDWMLRHLGAETERPRGRPMAAKKSREIAA